jgi:hypothetical protein
LATHWQQEGLKMSDVATETDRNSAPGKIKLLALSDLDGRTNAAKAAKALVSQLESDMGGADRLSAAERALVVRAAITTIMLEHIETGWLAGGEMDVASYATLTNNLRRLLTTIGLKRAARDVTPDLNDYIAKGGA